jgi:gamma-glutamylcyclotransferase (GGCT)/AIG2-like uncharacterized protein YtfP
MNVFVYGSVLGRLPAGCRRLGEGELRGTVYELPELGPVLMLYGDTRVRGEVWRCPAAVLGELDRLADVARGRFRRVARQVAGVGGGEGWACWLYVAGPGVARRLAPERRALG